jgi:hypothetical protein
VQEDPVRGRRKGAAVLVRAGRTVGRKVHEVRDHLDRLLHLELDLGGLPEELRDRGDRVRALDAEARHLVEGTVLSDQRDVGAVQRGHQPGRRIAHELPGQEAGDGVGDRVVDVQQVEPALARDFGHLGRQREVVGRVVEEPQRGAIHLVEADVLVELVGAHQEALRDEVDLVVAARQVQPQLVRDRARAAHGRVAGDADPHEADVTPPA